MSEMNNIAIWMSQPHTSFLEQAYGAGFRNVVVEVEHGTFDLATADSFLALTRALGVRTLVKVLAPTTEAIQQALDFGADGVIIPHLLGVEHVRAVSSAAKYPDVGVRSYSSGRVFGYKRPTSEDLQRENRRTRCFAMIETAECLADINEIAALDTVDGLFPGPADLSLARGRGSYSFSDADRADLLRCIHAARAAGKPWIMPAWTAPERTFARDEQAEMLVVATQNMTIRNGLSSIVSVVAEEERRT